jgi:cell division protein YceG involved in septum cleavage
MGETLMNKSTNSNKTRPASLSPLKPAGILFLTLLLTASLFLTSCSKPSSPAFQEAVQPTETTSQTTEPPAEPPKQKAVIGIIDVQGGAMLERDIIPQLCTVFSLSEEKVKETLSSAISSTLINAKLTDFRRMEGMIPPGKYEITEGSSLEEKVSAWVSESEKRYSKLLLSNTSPNKLTPVQQLSLAAMVEAECLSSAHHEEVATVFLNRLEDGSKLQSCVTAEYANGYQRPYLTTGDIAKESDYNTYYVSGLPIGPICAISDISLQAAISKKMDKRIYYFYYDYIQNDMFFYTDYKKFRKDGAVSRQLFEDKSSIDKREKINKQALYSNGTIIAGSN